MSVGDINLSQLKRELLTRENYCPDFSCIKNDPLGLNDFYHKQAIQYHEERLGRTYIWRQEENTIAFITVAMAQTPRKEIPKGDRTPVIITNYPALFIGRLAVDDDYQEKGIGTEIIQWCLGLAIRLSNNIGCRYVILETNEERVEWYTGEKRGFKILYINEKENGEKDYWLYKKIELNET